MAKTFKDNPALQFITTPQQPDGSGTQTPKPEPGFYYKPIEVKSQRLQLVMQPSLLLKAKARASEKGISLNEYMHQLIRKDLETNGNDNG